MRKRYSSKIIKFEMLSNELSEEMNFYPAASYMRHLLTARSTVGHGVHSPYIYDFLTNIVRKKTPDNIVRAVEGLRREMLTDRRIIRVTDLGAGSVRQKGEERRVSEIARHATLPAKETGLLARMVQSTGLRVQGSGCKAQGEGYSDQGSEIILELGTSLGISTLAMALAAPQKRVVTVEGCPVLAETARANLQRYGAGNVEVVNTEFSTALTRLMEARAKVLFAFIDGDHRGEALKEYVTKISQMGEEMIIVADDIHLARDMYDAWISETVATAAPATMETHRFGILFRLRSITPGHYRIRY
jgi:hypothetical protein